MVYRFLADLVLVIHFVFILFVVVGGLVALRYRGLIFLHLPALSWGVFVELSGRICPLTPWENRLRLRAGEQGYVGGFIEHYLLPVVYPPELTRDLQWSLGFSLAAVNVVVYGVLLYRCINSKKMIGITLLSKFTEEGGGQMIVPQSDNGYVAALPGIGRKTLAYGDKTLMVQFRLEKGSELPLHFHPYEQTGYLISGRMQLTIGGKSVEIGPGDSWCIAEGVEHGALVREDAVAVEVFSPVRPDYLPSAVV